MRAYRLVVAVLLFVCIPPGWVTMGAATGPSLRAGAAKIEITPQKPVKMSGYASRKGLSTDVHDPLSARVLAFESGSKRLVLVSVDVIGFYNGTADYLRNAILGESGLDPSELFLCAIHTHSAPTLTIDKEKGHPNNVEYTENLKDRLIEGVRQALSHMRPAGVGIGVGSCPVGANRRELKISDRGESSIVLGRRPYGPTDKEVLVMTVAGSGGTPIAVAFDYATHGTSLGPANYVISGDVIGLAEQFVERIVAADAIAPAFVGASGNIDPWFRILPAFNNEPGWVPEPVLLGTFLGEEVVHVYRRIETTATATPIRTAFAAVQLPAKPSEEPSQEADSSSLPFNITVARLGDIALVGLGGEVLTQIGVAIKAGSPCKHTFIITHCNGAAGYLVPQELFVEGGYEVRSTAFGPAAADMVVRESLRMLHGL
jgi:neutral ceramidase